VIDMFAVSTRKLRLLRFEKNLIELDDLQASQDRFTESGKFAGRLNFIYCILLILY
jgi:hypothetical protein